VLALPSGETEGGDGRRRVIQQPLLEGWIRPGFCDDFRPVPWTDLRLIGVDQGVQRGRIDIALLDQQGLERPDAQLDIGQFGMFVIVVMVAHPLLRGTGGWNAWQV